MRGETANNNLWCNNGISNSLVFMKYILKSLILCNDVGTLLQNNGQDSNSWLSFINNEHWPFPFEKVEPLEQNTIRWNVTAPLEADVRGENVTNRLKSFLSLDGEFIWSDVCAQKPSIEIHLISCHFTLRRRCHCNHFLHHLKKMPVIRRSL